MDRLGWVESAEDRLRTLTGRGRPAPSGARAAATRDGARAVLVACRAGHRGPAARGAGRGSRSSATSPVRPSGLDDEFPRTAFDELPRCAAPAKSGMPRNTRFFRFPPRSTVRNRVRGLSGSPQRQAVVPLGRQDGARRPVDKISASGHVSSLDVFTTFGRSARDRWRSPHRGWTPAVDFPDGPGLGRSRRGLDATVLDAGDGSPTSRSPAPPPKQSSRCVRESTSGARSALPSTQKGFSVPIWPGG